MANTPIRLGSTVSLPGEFNIMTYGALGTGVDDTVAIAATVTAAGVGGCITIPPGTFITDPISLLDGQTIKGISHPGIPSKSILQARLGLSVIDINNALGADNYTIKDLEIRGRYNAGAFIGDTSHGIWIHGGTTKSGIRIENVNVWNFGGSGIFIDANYYTRLQDVEVFDCGSHLFNIQGGNTTLLDQCYAHGHIMHAAGDAVCGFRVHGGSLTMIACNGIDASNVVGANRSWGIFGDVVAWVGR
jgi:hypothetical protein